MRKFTDADFWSRVWQTEDGCWLWLGTPTAFGYGHFRGSPPDDLAHRYSYRTANNLEAIPNGLFVLHRCNIRACVNPKHLYLGTDRDNTNDRILDKPRNGERNPRALLTEDEVRAIKNGPVVLGRSSFADITAEAGRYGVSYGTIYDILKGRTWGHL